MICMIDLQGLRLLQVIQLNVTISLTHVKLGKCDKYATVYGTVALINDSLLTPNVNKAIQLAKFFSGTF